MRLIVPLVAAAIAVIGCTSPASNLPAVDGTCPYGHHALRKVPVLVGLIAIGPDLQRRIDRHEVIYGGCTGIGHSSGIICATCGFELDDTAWVRESQNLDSFRPSISKPLRAFRKLGLEWPPRYIQRASTGALYEEVSFISTESQAVVRTLVAHWFKDSGLNPVTSARGPGACHWEAGEWSADATFMESAGHPSNFVIVRHRLGLATASAPAGEAHASL